MKRWIVQFLISGEWIAVGVLARTESQAEAFAREDLGIVRHGGLRVYELAPWACSVPDGRAGMSGGLVRSKAGP